MLIEDIFKNNGVIAKKSGSYDVRPQQVDMALAIEKSINESKHLIVEAGTGVGKSMAYLVPFILWTVKEKKRVVISTYTKTLQEQLINKDLPFLRNALRCANTGTSSLPGRQTGVSSFELGTELDFSFALCVGGQNYLCLRRYNQVQMYGLIETKKEIKEFQRIIQWEKQTKSGLRFELDFEPSRVTWSKICRESDLCFGRKCVFKEECYYNKARRKEFKAHILVTNHHLYFANLVNEGRVLPKFDAVVFDEAHTLEDVATAYLGIQISNLKVKFLLDSIRNPKTGKGLIKRLIKSPDRIETAIQRTLEEAREYGERFFAEIIEEFGNGKLTNRIRKKGIINNYLNKPLSDLSKLLKSLLSLAKTDEEVLEIDAFVRRCDEINQNISTVINQDLKEFVYWIEVERKSKSGHTLSADRQAPVSNTLRMSKSPELSNHRYTKCSLLAAPVNIADEFKKQIFDKIRPVILTSATLSTNGNFNYIKERLGIPACRQTRPAENQNGTRPVRHANGKDYYEKIIGSPFNFSENALIYIPAVNQNSTRLDNNPDPNQETHRYKNNIIKQIKDLLFITQGRSFVLFTSFEMLNTVYEGLKNSMDSFSLFKQGDKPRYRLVEEFKTSKKPVLFGTTTFWQGIDVPGRELECVIITKLPFAVPDDPIIEARMELLKSQNKNPFIHYQVPQAVIMLRQGFGRLIRTKADIGVVAILDPRIKTRYYGRYFLNSLPKCNKVSNTKDIKKFLVQHSNNFSSL